MNDEVEDKLDEIERKLKYLRKDKVKERMNEENWKQGVRDLERKKDKLLTEGESFLKKMEQICKCSHTRHMHNNMFSRWEEGEPLPNGEKDGACKVNDCECEEYTEKDSY